MSLKTFDLSGKTALITGAAGLLGSEHARAFLEAGASVVLTDVNSKALEELESELQAKGRVFSRFMDVTDKSTCQAVCDEMLSLKQPISILVNNAAIDPKVEARSSDLELSRFENFDLQNWNFQISVGLTGAFVCSQVFGTHMANNSGGVILNIASDLSVIAPDQRLYRNPDKEADQQPVKPVTYSVIKTGLIGMTRYLSTYWADKNIRVNALSPGGVYNSQPDDFVTRLSHLIPLGRMARKDEYRSAIVFLCSDASSYMTGQNIVMDGGRSVL